MPTVFGWSIWNSRHITQRKNRFCSRYGWADGFFREPSLISAFFTIPHAGFRYGIAERLDAGLRLAPIPLPFASVGPGFGVNLDVKYCFTPPQNIFTCAFVLGAGGAHVLLEEVSRYAYSPNGALLGTFRLKEGTHATVMARYVYLAIPTAPKGSDANNVHISGVSFGIRKVTKSGISILPEVGVYNYDGTLIGIDKSGPGLQYGLMIATSF
jgi:hypothetical protein